MEKEKNKGIFSPTGLLTIFLLLMIGLIVVLAEKSGKIFKEDAFQYPVINPSQIKKYKIGFVADAHSRVTKKGDVRLESKIPMENFVSEMNNNFHPNFVVDGGDFIDGTRRFGSQSMKDYSEFSKIFEKIEAPKYKVLGNHELRGMTREEWKKINNYEKSYYYFDFEDLRVIIFDNTLMPDPDDLSKEKAYKNELAWLENLLQNSEGYKKIIFTHYSFIPSLRKALSIEIINEFNDLTSKYAVSAVFSGHVEVPYYEKLKGVDYFVVPGFFRSKATGMLWSGSFSEIQIGSQNSLKLFYKNDMNNEYKTFIMPSAEYEAIKEEIKSKINFMAPVD